MNEWMNIPVSQLKRLVKSRAGRIAELQMEVKILGGIIEKKVSEGDLGGSVPGKPAPEAGNPEKPGEAGPPAEKEPAETKIAEKSSNHAFQEID